MVKGLEQPIAETRVPLTLRGEIRSVGRHSLIYVVGPALSNVVGFFMLPIYTHYIDGSHYGIMSLVDVVMNLVMMVIGLGLAEGMTRFYYEQTDERTRRRLVSTAVLGSALLSLPLILLSIVLATGLQYALGLSAEYLGYLRLALMTAWFSMLAEIGFAYLRLGYFAKTFVSITAIQIAAAVSLNLLFVVGFGWGIWGILYSSVMVQASLGIGLTAIVLSRCGWCLCRTTLGRLLRFGTYLVPSALTLQLTNYLNPLLLRWLLQGDPLTVLAQVGLYSMGQRVGVVVNRFVTVPFHAFWKPRRMELVIQDTPEVRQILARICTYAMLVTCQIALLISVGAEDLLTMVLHPDYWQAHRVVPWVCLGYAVLGLEHHFGTGMLYANQTRWAPLIGLAALSAMLVADLSLVPRYGFVAAAVATVISLSVRTGLTYWVSQRAHPIPFEKGRLSLMTLLCVAIFYLAKQAELASLPAQFAVRLAIAGLLTPCAVIAGIVHVADWRGLMSGDVSSAGVSRS